MDTIINWLIGALGGIVTAVLLLVLAFIISAIVRGLVVKLLNKTRLAKAEETVQAADGSQAPENKKESLITYIGKITYLLVFLLFVPGIFSALGVSAISDPISGLLNTVWGYMPNIIAAVVVLVAGVLVAKLVRELLIPLFQKIQVDKLQEKAGLEVKDDARLSVTLAYIVYVLILIPVIIAALQALRITVITEPAVNMLQKVLTFIPNIVVALILILIGTRVARFTSQIVRQLIASSGADENVRKTLGDKVPKFVLSSAIGTVIRVVLDAFFIVEGVRVLKLDVLTNIGETVIGYLPSVLASILIAIAAFLLAAAAEKAMEKNGLKDYSVIVRAAIMVVAAFMILNQLGIAQTIVNYAFIIILAAVGVAVAISFGVGGRGFAARLLDKLGDQIDKNGKSDKDEKSSEE